jgi:hypothetical protein
MQLMLKYIALIFISFQACASSTLFYSGEAITTMGSNVSRHPYLLARTTDQEKSIISESVVSFQRNRFKENSSEMKIAGNQLTMTEDTKMVTGTGELTGTPWKWTFLRAEFLAPAYKMRIVDYNFLADESVITGHKDFFRKLDDGTEVMFMQEDVVLRNVDEKTYLEKRAELLK